MPSAQLPATGTISSAKARPHYCPTCRLNKTRAHTQAEAEPHDAILQRLDRKVGGLTFPKEPFIPTVDSWDGIPIVFAKKHLDPLKPIDEAELARLNAAIIGDLQKSKILISGGARLEAQKVYSLEPALRMFEDGLISEETLERSKAALARAMELNDEGKLSHSTAFLCPDDGESLIGTVQPHHVLDFEETPTDQPVDKGAVILNKETVNVTPDPKPHANQGRVLSSKNEGRLKSAFDAIKSIFDEITGGGGDESGSSKATPKTNAEVTVVGQGSMNTPDGESLEDQIEHVRQALTETINLRWQDGTQRSVWTVMTLPDQVIWQHPDTSQYFATPYTVGEDGAVTFGQPAEVEQAYVLKQANAVLNKITAEDLENIAKRNKMAEAPKTETDPKIAQLQKERDDLAAENARLQKEAADLKAEQEKVRLQKEDDAWNDLKKTTIPPGLVKDANDEAALRKLQKEDNPAFLKKILAARAPGGTRQEGQVHVQGPTGDTEAETKKAETLATIRELRSSTGRMGR